MIPDETITDEQLMEMLDGGVAILDDPALAVMVVADEDDQSTSIVVHSVEVWHLQPETNESPVAYARRVDQARLLAQRVVWRMEAIKR